VERSPNVVSEVGETDSRSRREGRITKLEKILEREQLHGIRSEAFRSSWEVRHRVNVRSVHEHVVTPPVDRDAALREL